MNEWERQVLAAAHAVADAWGHMTTEAPGQGHYWTWMDAINTLSEAAQRRPAQPQGQADTAPERAITQGLIHGY